MLWVEDSRWGHSPSFKNTEMGLQPLQVEALLEVTNHNHPDRGLMLADLVGRIASPTPSSRLVSVKVGYLKGVSRGWRDDPMVKSTDYS